MIPGAARPGHWTPLRKAGSHRGSYRQPKPHVTRSSCCQPWLQQPHTNLLLCTQNSTGTRCASGIRLRTLSAVLPLLIRWASLAAKPNALNPLHHSFIVTKDLICNQKDRFPGEDCLARVYAPALVAHLHAAGRQGLDPAEGEAWAPEKCSTPGFEPRTAHHGPPAAGALLTAGRQQLG